MDGLYILDANGEPVPVSDVDNWGTWIVGGGNRHVGRTLSGDVYVSTVFLGVDHRFGASGPPLLFETMVFGGPLDGEQERYCTRAEAIAGHAAMVERVEQAK